MQTPKSILIFLVLEQPGVIICIVCLTIHASQALVAVSEVTKEISDLNSDFDLPDMKPTDYTRFLVLSLGTGSSKSEEKYSAKKASKWGVLGWLTNGGSTPLVDVYTQASADMVDIHLSTVFQSLKCENYLRIQVIHCLIFIKVRYCTNTGILNRNIIPTKKAHLERKSTDFIYLFIF